MFNLVFLGIWFINPRQNGCGPIPEGYGWEPVENAISDKPVLTAVYDLLTFWPILWNIILVFILFT